MTRPVGHPRATRRTDTVAALARGATQPRPPTLNALPRASSPSLPILRWRAAAADPDRFGFTQTLAGAHELLEHYAQRSPTMAGSLLLDQAVDARRLGHTSASVSKPLLRAATLALWRENHGHIRPPSGWFDQSLGDLTRALRSIRRCPRSHFARRSRNCPARRGGYRALRLRPRGLPRSNTYLTRARRAHPVQDQVWDALRRHIRPDRPSEGNGPSRLTPAAPRSRRVAV